MKTVGEKLQNELINHINRLIEDLEEKTSLEMGDKYDIKIIVNKKEFSIPFDAVTDDILHRFTKDIIEYEREYK